MQLESNQQLKTDYETFKNVSSFFFLVYAVFTDYSIKNKSHSKKKLDWNVEIFITMYNFIRHMIRRVVNKLVKFQLGSRKCIKHGRLTLNFTPDKSKSSKWCCHRKNNSPKIMIAARSLSRITPAKTTTRWIWTNK